MMNNSSFSSYRKVGHLATKHRGQNLYITRSSVQHMLVKVYFASRNDHPYPRDFVEWNKSVVILYYYFLSPLFVSKDMNVVIFFQQDGAPFQTTRKTIELRPF